MKLTGNTDLKDALHRLDSLTKEEALMASAELQRRIHSVDDGVRGIRRGVEDVDNNVQSVHSKVECVNKGVQDVHDTVQGVELRLRGIDNKVQDVDDKVQGVHNEVYQGNRQHLTLLSSLINLIFLTGNRLRDNFRTWLSPPNPSQNHNILCDAHYKGTTKWFSGGGIFNDWKSSGSCLWIHGKRAFFLAFSMRSVLTTSKPIAGSGKSVLWFVLSPLLPFSGT